MVKGERSLLPQLRIRLHELRVRLLQRNQLLLEGLVVALELVVFDDELGQVLVHLLHVLHRRLALLLHLLAVLESAVALRTHSGKLISHEAHVPLHLPGSRLGLDDQEMCPRELFGKRDVDRGERIGDRVAHRLEDRAGLLIGRVQHRRLSVGGASRCRRGSRESVTRRLGSRSLRCLREMRLRT